jgi:uncharacterized protein YfiM (DUF2279 family)
MKPAFALYSSLVVSFISRFFSGLTCTYKAICSFCLVLFIGLSLNAQDTSASKNNPEQSIRSITITPQPVYPYNKTRVKIVAIGNVVGYSAAMIGLYAAWYKDYPQSNFHSFNDIGEWKGMDKIGHVYGVYAESKASMEMWRWTGISRKKRIWLGGLSGVMYHTVIETLDGFSSEWGWSWSDFAANITGSGMFIAQELAWNEQRFQLKWSFHRKRYVDASLNQRSNDIFGKSSPERFLKDYNGQTYWLSTGLRSFFPHSKIPAWLQVSIGTGIEGVFGASENIGKDKFGNIIFNRPDIKRVRQWYLAPDIDFTKIKTNKKGIKFVLNVLNIVKFPAPALEYSNGKMKFNWFYF